MGSEIYSPDFDHVVDESGLQLDQLHPHVWESILKFLSFDEKKELRLVNWSLHHLVDEIDGTFKRPFFGKQVQRGGCAIDARDLRVVADAFLTLLEVECTIPILFPLELEFDNKDRKK